VLAGVPRPIPLDEHVARFSPLNAEARAALRNLVPIDLERRQELKEMVPVAAYVVSGLLRLRFADRTGRDRTLDFAMEGWWIADWSSFFQSRPTVLTLEAVEDSQVVILSPDQYRLMVQDSGLGTYFRSVLQRMSAAAQRRLYLNAISSGEEMYGNFVRLYPEFVQRVPQYMLASFLGFTPEFLSKIRGKRAL
jgi:CRP/FNR family transcriptional regulator, anaerobic regulatory protein